MTGLPFDDGPDYTVARDEPRDEAGVLLGLHRADDEGMCLWCREPHPCKRLTAARMRGEEP